MEKKPFPTPAPKDPRAQMLFWITVGSLLLIIVIGWILSLSGTVQQGIQGVKDGISSFTSVKDVVLEQTADSREDVNVLINEAITGVQEQMQDAEEQAVEEQVIKEVAERFTQSLSQEQLIEEEVTPEGN